MFANKSVFPSFLIHFGTWAIPSLTWKELQKKHTDLCVGLPANHQAQSPHMLRDMGLELGCTSRDEQTVLLTAFRLMKP